MMRLLIISLTLIISVTKGLSVRSDNGESTTISNLDSMSDDLKVFKVLADDKNFTEIESDDDETSTERDDNRTLKLEIKVNSTSSEVNKVDNVNSTTTTTSASPSPSTSIATTIVSASTSTTPPPSSTTTVSPSPSPSPSSSSAPTTSASSSSPSTNGTVVVVAPSFDSNGTLAKEIISSLDSILLELNHNETDSMIINNALEGSSRNDLSPSTDFTNYFAELRVLDGLEALFESD